ncbi:MAG: Hsp70 family protein [Alphaproteobacteria bacterium]|nr:Hsp70 family protein [Alphaproteobacteria bacterium]
MMGSVTSIGIDFGTTNTVVAIASPGAAVRAVTFRDDREQSDIYRSVLCFEQLSAARFDVEVSAGIRAVRTYLESAHETRFIQSFKSHVASAIFDETRIFNRSYKLEDLLSEFFRLAIRDAGGQLAELDGRVISGRPVGFVGAAPDEALAVRRYDEAYRRIGIHDPAYAYEPVGAAYYFAQRLKSDALVLVSDFGGGTSDFSLIQFERRGDRVAAIPIGHAGLGVAGDSFDFRIIDAVVAPLLGKGTEFRSLDKILPIPQHYYASFARWHQLAMLKTPEHLRELDRLRRASFSPEKIAMFLDIIRNDWGFNIYRAVSDAKVRLSSAHRTTFGLRLGKLDIETEISRADFERWIAHDVARIEQTVDRLLHAHGVAVEEIDSVFLTGGSSLIPAVQHVFVSRFGADRLAGGENFRSVAFGLALIGLEDAPAPWLAPSPV